MLKNGERKTLWEKRLKDWNQSGLSIQRWCADNKLSSSSFYYWRKMFESSDKVLDTKSNNWVELNIDSKDSVSEKTLSIQLQYQDFTLHIPEQFDDTCLAKILSVMRTIC